MKIINFIFVLLFLAVFTPKALSQTVYEPINNSVYEFLEGLSLKGLLHSHNEVKPYSRINIAADLVALENQKELLTHLETQELRFYLNDFADEIKLLKKDVIDERMEYFTFGENNRFRAYNYRDSLFSIYIDPVLGYSKSSLSETSHFWSGLSVYGYISNYLGYSLNFNDNQEKGQHLDYHNSFSPVTGRNLTGYTNESFQYDEVNAMLSLSWSWGIFSFGKDFISWGSSLGPTSQLIFSGKAPSFPLIQLQVYPVKWLRFNYIHGWLHSGLLDSSTIHYSPGTGRTNYMQVDKFIAAHLLSVDVNSNITLSLGESMVYSERLQPLYFIPVMFFRLADHYLTKDSSNTGSNAQIFADAYFRIPSIRSKFYGTLFIDELSVTAVLENKNGASAVGYTIGGEIADPFIGNSIFFIEYSKLPPFLYSNSNLAQTYTSYGYQLGNWIGNNGDILSVSYSQKIVRGLSVKFWGNYIRKGSIPEAIQQYTLPYPPTLFGLKKVQKEFGLQVEYEIINNLLLKIFYNVSDISDEDFSRTPAYILGSKKDVGFSVSYGFNKF